MPVVTHYISDFSAYFGIQPVPFFNVGINPKNILRLGKNIKNGGNTGLFKFLDWEAACIQL